MELKLVPDIPDPIIFLLETIPKSFLLIVYDSSGQQELKGCILANNVDAIRVHAGKVAFRILKCWTLSSKPRECVLCHREQYAGWTFQPQSHLEMFLCNGCFLGN